MRSPRTCSTNRYGPLATRLHSAPGSLDVLLRLDERDGGEQALGHLVAERHRRLVEAHGDGLEALDLHALDCPELQRERVGGVLPGDGDERRRDALRRQLALASVERDPWLR